MKPMPTLLVEDAPAATKLSLVQNGAELAHLFIIPFRIRIGAAVVEVDGIGDVWTADEHRNQGHARRLMEEAVRRMRAGDSALSVLYGIPDFYHKFGYAPAGAEQLVVLTELARGASLPDDWRVRRALPDDLAALRALYDRTTATVAGAAVRETEGEGWSARAWTNLAAALVREDIEDCRVVEAPDGQIVASCWRGEDASWFVRANEQWSPETMAFAEVLAESVPAAEAVLAACRTWALEEGARRERPVTSVTLGVPLHGAIGSAARFQDARLVQNHYRAGGFMARTLDPQRLLTQLLPELQEQLHRAGKQDAALRIATDEGNVALRLGQDVLDRTAQHTANDSSAVSSQTLVIEGDDALAVATLLPQTVLTQLALGALPPEDLLPRLDPPLVPQAAELLRALFPERQPHIFPPDRP
jgi:hypothetical protein